ASQMSMTLGALLLLGVALCELDFAFRRTRAASAVDGLRRCEPPRAPTTGGEVSWATRAGIYFCAAAIYCVSVSGVACVDMESMLRYEFCVQVLMLLALLNFLRQFSTQ